MKTFLSSSYSRALAGFLGAAALGAALVVSAGGVPLSHEASPEVYKVIAENDEFRVIMATWQPGQRDRMHSHPSFALYKLTGCKARIFKANGKTKDINAKAGGAKIKGPVKKHAFQNIGKTVCKTLLVESKK